MADDEKKEPSERTQKIVEKALTDMVTLAEMMRHRFTFVMEAIATLGEQIQETQLRIAEGPKLTDDAFARKYHAIVENTTLHLRVLYAIMYEDNPYEWIETAEKKYTDDEAALHMTGIARKLTEAISKDFEKHSNKQTEKLRAKQEALMKLSEEVGWDVIAEFLDSDTVRH